ncbi:Flp family type IVb pilin [Massilia sp. YMA4]|uniref:Flp family type IVb pilin n=1 Tax=Massilia sp. YMA4 TaxID=1593482 RepID=UPI000DD117D1|nr:Flp family type IVb pilin [Massilia sp. YMA4]AXA93278.1 Flp family type IVb pilin [Massilia sp. YMA4]
MNFIKNFIREEDGVTAIEYALIAALVAAVIAAGATALGTNIKDVFNSLATKIKSTTTTS